MAITSRSVDLLLQGVRAEFAYVVDQAEKQLSAFESNVYLDASTKMGGLFAEIGAGGRQRVEGISVTGVSQLLPTEELQEFPETSYVPSYVTAVEPFKFTRRVKVSRESAARRDARYTGALNEAAKLRVAAENTIAAHRYDRLNRAFSVANVPHLFDYGDGVPLVATNHPTKIGTVRSNIVTASDISNTSVEAMMLVLQSQVDDIGEPMPMGGGQKYLIVAPARVRRAREVLDSEWVADTMNNNINVWRGQGWILISSPRLTSATAWFVVDAVDSPLKHVMFRPTTYETWADENVKAFVHDISFEHKIGAFDYRGLVGNLGA
jgi:hypothetical protein